MRSLHVELNALTATQHLQAYNNMGVIFKEQENLEKAFLTFAEPQL